MRFLLILLFISFNSFGQTFEERFNSGLQLINNSKFNEAIIVFTKLIEIDPLSTNAYVNRALAKEYLGNYSDAIIDLTKAIEINPNLGVAYLNRGKNNQAIKDFNNAISDYSQVLQIDIENAPPPIHSFSYLNRGSCYYELFKYELAINDFNEAIKLNPNLSQAYFNRAMAKANSGQSKFCDDFQKAYELGNAPAKEYIYNYCNDK